MSGIRFQFSLTFGPLYKWPNLCAIWASKKTFHFISHSTLGIQFRMKFDKVLSVHPTIIMSVYVCLSVRPIALIVCLSVRHCLSIRPSVCLFFLLSAHQPVLLLIFALSRGGGSHCASV